MQLDDILVQVGQFGKYQKRQYFLLVVPAVFVALNIGASVFVAATPKFRCELPRYAFNGTDTYQVRSEAHSLLIAAFIPSHDGRYVSCKIRNSIDLGSNSIEGRNLTTAHDEGLIPCTSYVFSDEEFKTSIVTEFKLVCNEQLKVTLSTMVFMSGVLVGSFFFGMLSDIFGRRKTLLISMLISGISGLGSAFSPEFYSFVIIRFVSACSNMGVYMTAFVAGIELIGPKYRLTAGIVIDYFFALGFVILPGVAYLTQRWNYTLIAIIAPIVLLIPYYWFITESPRWLLSKGRVQDAEVIMQKMGKVNGVILPQSVFETLQEKQGQKEKFTAIFRAKTLIFRTVIVFFNWLTIAMIYYGLSLNSGSIGGNAYVNFALSGLVEFPAYSCCFLCSKLGRKRLHISGMFTAGLACVGTIIVDHFLKGINESTLNIYFVALNLVGKFGVTISFGIIYIWSAEIYPTTLRNSLMGISSVFGRVGSMVAPIIADLGNYVDPEYKRTVPASLFSALVIMGGGLALFLPETTGKRLADTVCEANSFPHPPLDKEEVKLSDRAEEEQINME